MNVATPQSGDETGIGVIDRKWPRAVLPGIIIALSGWYLATIVWDSNLPFSHDELNFLQEALRLPAERKIASYGHGPLLYEILAGLEVVYYLVLRIAGSVQTPFDFLVEVQSRFGPLYETGRILIALAGVATVIQVYRLGVIFGGRATGGLAALLCATNLTFLMMTSMVKEDVFYWFFLLLAMELAWKSSEHQSRRTAAWTGVAIGCATAAKYFGVFAAPLALLPAVRSNGRRLREALMLGVIMGAVAGATLLILFPFLITDTAQVLSDLRETNSRFADIEQDWALYAYIRYHLPNLLGWTVFIFGGVELVRRLVREPTGPILLLTAPIMQFLFVGLRQGFSLSYYAFPLALSFFVLAASLAVHIASAAGATRWRWSAVWILVAVAMLDSAFLPGAVKYGLLLTGPETRMLARDVIVSKARAGDCVLMNVGILGTNIFGPPLVPTNPPPGKGAFTRARVIASERMSGPRFDVRVLDTYQIPAEATRGCEWLVLGRRGQESHVERGTGPITMAQPTAPAGYTAVTTIEAFPEEHSYFYPLPTTLDYDALRATSIGTLWRERAMGPSFDIYRRSSNEPRFE